MRVVSVSEVRRAQAYILVYVRSHAHSATAAAADASADSSMKLPVCSLPRFSEMHKRSSEDGWMSLKRRKTTIWWSRSISHSLYSLSVILGRFTVKASTVLIN